jgi:hypothetical protein
MRASRKKCKKNLHVEYRRHLEFLRKTYSIDNQLSKKKDDKKDGL